MDKFNSNNSGKPWKGLEKESYYKPEVRFQTTNEKNTKKNDAREIDMTPMVDVTFLLLIFFMVTASFVFYKSFELPLQTSELPSDNQWIDDHDEFIELSIDQYNTYRLTSRNLEEIEAASDTEMRKRLKEMIEKTNAKRLVIKHHGDAHHEKVVTAWDSGVHNNIGDIRTQLTEVSY